MDRCELTNLLLSIFYIFCIEELLFLTGPNTFPNDRRKRHLTDETEGEKQKNIVKRKTCNQETESGQNVYLVDLHIW